MGVVCVVVVSSMLFSVVFRWVGFRVGMVDFVRMVMLMKGVCCRLCEVFLFVVVL